MITLENTPTNKMQSGFQDFIFEFKREDAQVVSGSDGYAGIAFTLDAEIDNVIGEYIYIYSEGEYRNYDSYYKILDIDGFEVTVESEYYGDSTSGYCNYHKNYSLEVKVIDTLNEYKIIDNTFRFEDNLNGVINAQLNTINDYNYFRFEPSNRKCDEQITSFRLAYRERWKGKADLEAEYVLIPDIYTLLYSSDNMTSNVILNELSMPEIFEGYASHYCIASQNVTGTNLDVYYTELDINKESNGTSMLLNTLELEGDGYYLFELDKDTSFKFNSEYISVDVAISTSGHYDPDHYDSDDYFTST